MAGGRALNIHITRFTTHEFSALILTFFDYSAAVFFILVMSISLLSITHFSHSFVLSQEKVLYHHLSFFHVDCTLVEL